MTTLYALADPPIRPWTPESKLLGECAKSAGVDLQFVDSLPAAGIVVALGNDAMKALTGKSGITEKRGEELTVAEVTILPTFHPSYVLRARAQRPTLVKDLVRAKHLADGTPLEDPARSIQFIDGPPAFPPIASLWAVDVETDEHDKPRLFAVGESPDCITVHPATPWQPGRWDAAEITWLGHNLRADQLWLREIGVELGPRREDTMLMAHLLNENRKVGLKKLALELLDPRLYWKYVEPLLKRADKRGAIEYEELGTYCANDVAATLLIYDALSKQLASEPRLEALYRKMSLPLSDVLLEVEHHGVLFDSNAGKQMLYDYEKELMYLSDNLDQIAGRTGVNWGSAPQVSDLLYNHLGLPVTIKSKKTGKPSTEEKALMKLLDKHPVVRALLRWREIDKQRQMIESWMKRQRSTGRVHPSYNQTGTVTGRLSGREPNPQNVPLESFTVNSLKRSLRELIIAPPDHSILSADYATIELGVGSWIFDEPTMFAAYCAGQDLHTLTATKLLGRAPADKVERKKYGKTPNFGLLYQQGDQGFMEYAAKNGVTLTLDEARAMRAAWHSIYPGVRAGWRKIGYEMKANGGVVVAPSGRKRRLPEFLSGNSSLVNEAWRQGCNFPVQCTAAEFTHIAAILAAPALAELYDAYLILHVHDSLVFELPTVYVPLAARILKRVMEQEVPAYFEREFGVRVPIPLRVDIGAAPNWGLTGDDAYKVDLQALA